MRSSTTLLTFALLSMAAPAAAQSQSAPVTPQTEARTAAQQLSPVASVLLAPAATRDIAAPAPVVQPAIATRGEGFAMAIAGGALFVAGLLVGGDAGTLMAVGGAGVGAYGLYLYFR